LGMLDEAFDLLDGSLFLAAKTESAPSDPSIV
jgi:hypothetical protein